MANRRRFSRTKDILNRAKRVEKDAQRFLDKHESRINAEYNRAKADLGREMAKAEQLNKALGRGLDRMLGEVSDEELNAVLNEATTLELPSVPTHDPARSRQHTAKRHSDNTPTIKQEMPEAKRRKVDNPNAAKIQALQTEINRFNSARQSLKASKNTSALMQSLKQTVGLIDAKYGTKSKDYCNKLQSRMQGLKKLITEVKRLKAHVKHQPNNPSLRNALAETQTKFQKDNAAFKKDLTAYAKKVHQTVERHMAKCSKDVTALKQAAHQDNNTDNNNTRGFRPGRS